MVNNYIFSTLFYGHQGSSHVYEDFSFQQLVQWELGTITQGT
jgi:hypothetical protein